MIGLVSRKLALSNSPGFPVPAMTCTSHVSLHLTAYPSCRSECVASFEVDGARTSVAILGKVGVTTLIAGRRTASVLLSAGMSKS